MNPVQIPIWLLAVSVPGIQLSTIQGSPEPGAFARVVDRGQI